METEYRYISRSLDSELPRPVRRSWNYLILAPAPLFHQNVAVSQHIKFKKLKIWSKYRHFWIFTVFLLKDAKYVDEKISEFDQNYVGRIWIRHSGCGVPTMKHRGSWLMLWQMSCVKHDSRGCAVNNKSD